MAFTEDLERKVDVLADATANNTSKIEVNRTDFEKSIQQIDHRLMTLEVSVKQGFEQVDRRFEQVDRRFEQVDRRFEQVDRTIEEMGKNLGGLSVEITRLAAEVSRISTHLGVQGPPPG
jgi:methyl-accepting chemotaxis protein